MSNLYQKDNDTMTGSPGLCSENTGDSDSPTNMMQLSLDNARCKDDLPTYPIADTIALMLILLNFPNILITVSYLLFSYREHTISGNVMLSQTNPPVAMVLFLDVVVVLFVSVALPSLRTSITDVSHMVVAISLSGAKWRIALPFAIGIAALRGSVSKLSHAVNLHDFHGGLTSFLNLASHSIRSSPYAKTSQETPEIDPPVDFGTSAIDYVRSAIAVHIFAFSILRLCFYWMHSTSQRVSIDSSSNNSTNKSKRKISPSEHRRSFRGLSMWDHLLRWRVDVSGRKHDLMQVSPGSENKYAWVSQIAPRHLVFEMRSDRSTDPDVTLRVNGLAWDARATPVISHASSEETSNNEAATSLWELCVDNLSPKTEYEISLQFSEQGSKSCSYHFSVSTSSIVEVPNVGRRRGDSQLLPILNTNLVEDGSSSVDAANSSSGPMSPVTTLEESINIATSRLDEKKFQLKRTRKEYAKKLQQLQREFDHLALRMNGGNDKHEQRMQGRMLSLQNEVKRIQDSIDEMETERVRLISTKEMQNEFWEAEKQRRDEEARILDDIRIKYNSEKAKHQKRFSTVEAEALKTKAKADKMSLRRTKIQQDLDRISNEQDDILHQEYQIRAHTREMVKNQRLQIEAEYLKAIHEMTHVATLNKVTRPISSSEPSSMPGLLDSSDLYNMH